jgi:hypothetical protein|tara:strand:- start:553 stop:798 length:246 start_codon:yes stop_codon:yes gene_type:complete
MSIKYEDHVPQPADPSKRHFYISLIKSAVRIIAGGVLAYAGYEFWAANDYTDIVISWSGYLMMFSGISFVIAEVLGIAEEL